MNLPEARGRMHQDDTFCVEGLAGTVVERLVGVATDLAKGPFLFMIKPVGRHWQQFFLDAGIAFWEEWPADMIQDNFEDCDVVDYGETLQLVGMTVQRVTCQPGPCMRIVLSSGVFYLRSANPQDLDAATVVEYQPSA
jgi:hypothetical protein